MTELDLSLGDSRNEPSLWKAPEKLQLSLRRKQRFARGGVAAVWKPRE